MYHGGKIYTLPGLQIFRVKKRATDRVDFKVPWAGDKATAYAKCKAMINDEGKRRRKSG